MPVNITDFTYPAIALALRECLDAPASKPIALSMDNLIKLSLKHGKKKFSAADVGLSLELNFISLPFEFPNEDGVEVLSILRKWLTEGLDVAEIDGIENIPVHPELVYRLLGDWRGWNDFLGLVQSDSKYAENCASDRLETIAFDIYEFLEEMEEKKELH